MKNSRITGYFKYRLITFYIIQLTQVRSNEFPILIYTFLHFLVHIRRIKKIWHQGIFYISRDENHLWEKDQFFHKLLKWFIFTLHPISKSWGCKKRNPKWLLMNLLPLVFSNFLWCGIQAFSSRVSGCWLFLHNFLYRAMDWGDLIRISLENHEVIYNYESTLNLL